MYYPDLFHLLGNAIGKPSLSSPLNHLINLGGGKGGMERQLACGILKRLTLSGTLQVCLSLNGQKKPGIGFHLYELQKALLSTWISDQRHRLFFKRRTSTSLA